jgi:hypothetical protein
MGTEVFGGGTVNVWWAPVDTVKPDLTGATDPAAPWAAIGQGYISEDGLSADLANTITKVFVLRSTGPQRIYRTQEEPMVEFSLFESTIEALAIALHGTTTVVTDRDATDTLTGLKEVDIQRGATVRESAILFRSVSPYDKAPDTNKWQFQGWLPRGVFTKIGNFKFFKEQLTLPLTFEVLESTTTGFGFGKFSAQDAAVTT